MSLQFPSPPIAPSTAEGLVPRDVYEATMVATSLASFGTALADYSTADSVARLDNPQNAWPAGKTVITYSFPIADATTQPPLTGGSGFDAHILAADFRGFTETQVTFTRLAVSLWDDLIPLVFVDAGTSVDADTRFFNTTDTSNTATGAGGGSSSKAGAGDVIVYNFAKVETRDWSVGDFLFGNWFLHEIGHTLGIGHAGDYDNPNIGYNGLNYVQDSTLYSVMSYRQSNDADVTWNNDAATPMLHDIAAAQSLYGVDTTTRTGDTVYGFNSNITDRLPLNFDAMLVQEGLVAPITIWDAGGTDTLDLSGFKPNSEIDLNAGGYSNVNGQQMFIGIAYGVTIENAIGGRGDDTVHGNDVANAIQGLNGNDALYGRAGDDTMTGGHGNDVLDGGAGNDVLIGDGSNAPVDLTIYGVALNSDGATGQSLLQTSKAGLPQTALTIEIEVNFAQAPEYQTLLSVPGVRFLLDPTNSGAPGLWISVNGSWTYSSIPVTALGDGKGHRISFTWDSAAGAYAHYLDGSLTKSGTGLQSGTSLSATGTGKVSLSSVGGAVGDFRLFDHALTAAEIEAHATSPLTDPLTAQGLILNWQVDVNGSVSDARGGTAPVLVDNGQNVPVVVVHGATTFDDILSGGQGDDVLTGGAGNDLLSGGDGFDTAVYSGKRSDYSFKFNDDLSVTVTDIRDNSIDTLSGIESLSFAGAQVATGNAVNTAPTSLVIVPVMSAISENSSLATRVKVADIQVSDDGFGANVLRLSGDDQACFELDGSELFFNSGLNLDFETKPTYSVSVQAADQDLESTAGVLSQVFNFSLINVSPEVINGSITANTLLGANDSDHIFGFSGADRLYGFAGRDVLTGGKGRDILYGGADADVFDFNAVLETGKTIKKRDVIRDFKHGTDDIDLQTIDANGSAAGDAAFKFLAQKGAAFTGGKGQLTWFQHNAVGKAHDKTIVQGDINGDKVADFQIQLSGLKLLTAMDFIL
jgi:serralysin